VFGESGEIPGLNIRDVAMRISARHGLHHTGAMSRLPRPWIWGELNPTIPDCITSPRLGASGSLEDPLKTRLDRDLAHSFGHNAVGRVVRAASETVERNSAALRYGEDAGSGA